ncbi:unnamed protein product [Medioppia subpectinata]|uniref:Uncharacterized protein n=1 Tax=Medioppia subpectinata TaxID=1979941 RepID=A0A7R9KR81_9ACAR|nr:unnamed protein product [Medioppia subpectinata]CAG2106961.1 unnamed protein product [Medioppia subpectinata]
MSKQLSDRLLNPLKESMAKMFTTDYVQKILMTGEMSDENIRYAKIQWKASKDSYSELMKRAYSLAVTETDRKSLDVKAMNDKMTKYYDRFENELGGIAPELTARPMNGSAVDNVLTYYRELKRGSLLRILVIKLVANYVVYEIHEYLKRQPQYRPNVLANNMLFTDFDIKRALTVAKAMIDCNGAHISLAEGLELIQLAHDES